MSILRAIKKNGLNGDAHTEGGVGGKKDYLRAKSELKGKVSHSHYESVLKKDSHSSDFPHVSKNCAILTYFEDEEHASLGPRGVRGQ